MSSWFFTCGGALIGIGVTAAALEQAPNLLPIAFIGFIIVSVTHFIRYMNP